MREKKKTHNVVIVSGHARGADELGERYATDEKLDLEIPYGFSLKDQVVPENNGIFDFKGQKYQNEPVFEINAGHLLQVLVGYHSLKELQQEMIVFEFKKFEEINALLPKQKCYIIDEY